MNQKRTLAVVQLCLPHYRNALFAGLSQSDRLDFIIYAGEHSFSRSVKTAIIDRRIVFKPVANRFMLGNTIVWQSGFGKKILQADAVILEFNPRILSHFPILLIRKILRKPTLFWGIGFSVNASSGNMATMIRRLMSRMADALIFYSEKGKADFVNAGIDANKLFVASNAVNVSQIRKVSRQFSRQPQHIIFAGRLVPLKKVDLLIEGFKLAAEQLPASTNLIIIGDGDERERLKRLASSLGIESRVKLVGEVSNEVDLASYFSQACVGVSPGRCGLFAIHCLAHGVPVLVSPDEPHGPEINVLIDEINSRAFETDNVSSLAKYLTSFFEDLPQTIAMGKAGEAHVAKTYSIENMVDAFITASEYTLNPRF